MEKEGGCEFSQDTVKVRGWKGEKVSGQNWGRPFFGTEGGERFGILAVLYFDGNTVALGGTFTMGKEGLSGSTGTTAFGGPNVVLISLVTSHQIDWGGLWACHLTAK